MSLTTSWLAFVVALTSVGIKGFQHQKITGNHYCLVILTSYVIATFGIIAKNGWSVVVPLGTGGALGMVISMYIHRKYVRKVDAK